MPLPNLLVIGAQKCGTTALWRLLERHPDCAVGTKKESHFFVDEAPQPFGQWHAGIGWYASLYPRDAAVVADVCPSYANWPLTPGVAERAASVLPGATIVYLVRDPIDRVVSHWRHWVWRGYETRSFEASVLEAIPSNKYVPSSRYASQLARWTAVYPSDRILVMHQDEIRAGAGALFHRLGLAPLSDGNVVANSSEEMRVERFPALPERLRRRIPGGLRTKPVARPEITPAVSAQLWEWLGEDTAEFETKTGVAVLTDAHRAELSAN